MNLSTAITIALKTLRANEQSITDSHRLFIHAIDGKLIVAAFKKSYDETIAVVLPFKSDRVICGTFPASLRKLFRLLKNQDHQFTTALDDRGFYLAITGSSFKYRIDLTGQPIRIKKAIDLAINSNSVDSVIMNEEIATENTMQLITVTNNYFADLAIAIEAGLFIRNGRNPKKPDLYAAIDAHNAQCVSVTTVEESVAPSNEAYEALLTQFKEKKAAKNTIASKPPSNRAKVGTSGKSLDKSEVWEASRIRTVKRSSQMGRVLEYMFNNDGIAFVETDGLELTKAQFVQAIGSISEAGYGIVKTDDRFTVVLPKELEAPKLK